MRLMHRFRHLHTHSMAVAAAIAATSIAACDKVPLLAPTGSVINLTLASEVAALNSSVEVTAVVIEAGQASSGTGTATTTTTTAGAGTPVQNGTLVSFTTTIGHFDPSEARTTNGKVTVRLITDNASGKATVTAYSGGAKSTAQITIGAAAVARVTASASPQSLPSSGGSSTVSALVEDTNGNPVGGVSVVFSTTKGSVSPASSTTNSSGIATTTLTTTGAADVTATIGAQNSKVTVGVSTAATLSITGPTGASAVSSPVSITVDVGTSIRVSNVVVNYGDGQTANLGSVSGARTLQHYYADHGIFNISVSAVDPDNQTISQTSQIAIAALTVSLDGSASTVARGSQITFTATVASSGSGTPAIDHYEWDFGDGTTAESVGNKQTHVYDSTVTPGTKTVRVTVVPMYGATYRQTLQIPVT